MDAECRRLIARRAAEYLRRVAYGAYILLNRRSLSLYAKRFPDLLAESPLKALQLVKRVLGGDGGLIVFRNMVRVVTGDYEAAVKVVDALLAGNEEAAKRVLEQACRRLAR